MSRGGSMKLSCSDFTGGWSSSPEEAIAQPERLQPAQTLRIPAVPLDDLDFDDDADTVVEDAPGPPPEGGEEETTLTRRSPSVVPTADALADVLGPLFDRTDEVPALPFELDTPLDMRGLVAVSNEG